MVRFLQNNTILAYGTLCALFFGGFVFAGDLVEKAAFVGITLSPALAVWAGRFCLIFAFIFLCFVLYEASKEIRLCWKDYRGKSGEDGDDKILLKDAAITVRETLLNGGHTLIEVLGDEELQGGIDGRFNFIAEHIANGARLWGKRDKSEVEREIDRNIYTSQDLQIKDDGNTLRALNGQAKFCDLRVEKSHLEWFLREGSYQ